jgi:hypothetical protein
MSMRSFYSRLNKVAAILHPPIKDTRLPFIYLQCDDSDYPGYEAHNADMALLARRQGIIPDVYCATVAQGPWWEMDGVDA